VLKEGFKACQALIKSGHNDVSLEFCQILVSEILGNPMKFNVYDIREACKVPPLCYDFSPADNLLKNPDVQKVLGVPGRKWEECDS